MKVVKLTTAQARSWRANQSQWVSPEGQVLRAVTAEEEAAIFPAVQDAKRAAVSGKRTVTAEYKRVGADGQIAIKRIPFVCVFHIRQTGRTRREFVLDLTVGGNRYVKGRETIEKQLLARHGSFMLHGVNGKRIKVVRDPSVERPAYADNRSTPKPDNCVCRQWIGTVPGRHHPSCDYNRLAPIAERAETQAGGGDTYQPMDAPAEPTIIPEPGQAVQAASLQPPPREPLLEPTLPPTPAAAAPAAAAPVHLTGLEPTASPAPHLAPSDPPGPEDCDNDCRGIQAGNSGWAWPSGRRPERGQHHPLCKHADAWRRLAQRQTNKVLYDLAAGSPLRDASESEIAQAEISLARNGISSVLVGAVRYAVVDASLVRDDGSLSDEVDLGPMSRPPASNYSGGPAAAQPPSAAEPPTPPGQAQELPEPPGQPPEPPGQPLEPPGPCEQPPGQPPEPPGPCEQPPGPPEPPGQPPEPSADAPAPTDPSEPPGALQAASQPPAESTPAPSPEARPAPSPAPSPRPETALPPEPPAALEGEGSDESLRDEQGLVGMQRATGEIATGHVPGLERPDLASP